MLTPDLPAVRARDAGTGAGARAPRAGREVGQQRGLQVRLTGERLGLRRGDTLVVLLVDVDP
jgi:hypothetical protein